MMCKYFEILCLFLYLFQSGETQKVNVTVFYETLCGSSVRLIHRQLYPTWWDLKEFLNITFVPYGKAVQNKDANGTWVFDCQNGPEECYGNKIQSCALNELKNDSRASMLYVTCFMNYSNSYPYNTTCFEDVTSNRESKLRFEECVTSEKGDEILATNGDITATFPPFSYIPAMSFNGVYNYDFDSKARRNFKGAVCHLIESPKPAACPEKDEFLN